MQKVWEFISKRNVKESYSGRKRISPEGNVDLNKGINNTG